MTSDEFQENARRSFAFLFETYEFEEEEVPKKELAAQPFQIRFANRTTRLAVEGIHHGFAIDVRLSSRDPELMRESSYCFDDLLAIRAPTLDLRIHQQDDPRDRQEVEIGRYAAAVREYAADVLGGDFAVFSQLAKAIRRRRKRFKKERGL